MMHTISVLVENKAGVLSRISGLFARRGFNIDSLAVGVTEDPDISRITVVVNGDDRIAEQVEKQLNKQIDVLKVRRLSYEKLTRREVALVKVKWDSSQRGEIIDTVKIMEGKIVDLSHTTMTIEICDKPEKIDLLVELLSEYKIEEIARTGTVALQKGSGNIGA